MSSKFRSVSYAILYEVRPGLSTLHDAGDAHEAGSRTAGPPRKPSLQLHGIVMYVRQDDISLKGHVLPRYLAVRPGQNGSRPCHDLNVRLDIQVGRQWLSLNHT